MQKPASLRAAITAILPDLKRDADRLRMWVDKGKVRTPQTPSRNFAWEYTLSVYVESYTGHPAVLVHLINEWLRTNQPDLCQPGSGSGYGFEAEIIDAETFDLLFELPLTEAALVTPADGGGWTIEHLGELDPMFPDDLPLGDPASTLLEGWGNGPGGAGPLA